jgi:hypothetical protein
MADLIHYLSATVVNTTWGPRHLSFCNDRFNYDDDKHLFIIANYAEPLGVTCGPCMEAWTASYPSDAAAFEAKYPRPQHYAELDSEHPDVTELRKCYAELQRRYMRRWVNDESVDAVDLAYSFHRFTYAQMKELAQLAFRLHGDHRAGA